jgi:arylsulfatase A-like enzyme
VSNTPFRDTKLTGYEGGIRTPLIAHWPAGIAARGQVVHDIGHVIDLMPTFLELADGKYPAELDGRKPLRWAAPTWASIPSKTSFKRMPPSTPAIPAAHWSMQRAIWWG